MGNVPSSSISTRECSVACCRMADVSLSSTKNVLSPAQEIAYILGGSVKLVCTSDCPL